MALVPHSFLPRSLFDVDTWRRPVHLGEGASTLDVFDAFDDLDHLMSRNMLWLQKPDLLSFPFNANLPKVPEKYRITLDITGYSPKSIKIEYVNDHLVVSASEGVKSELDDDYHVKEFKRSYKLPENAEPEKRASFITSSHILVIEVPLKPILTPQQQQLEQFKDIAHNTDLFPKIVESADGAKSLSMHISLPVNIDPSKISVVCKDRDLIVKGHDKTKTHDHISSVHFYKRTTLPENTDWNHFECNLHDANSLHHLTITAPLVTDFKDGHKALPIGYHHHHYHKIPIHCAPQQQAIQHK
jgi:HSP20 family molecular chaperone IbpA